MDAQMRVRNPGEIIQNKTCSDELFVLGLPPVRSGFKSHDSNRKARNRSNRCYKALLFFNFKRGFIESNRAIRFAIAI